MRSRKLIALLLAFIMLIPIQVFAAGDDGITDNGSDVQVEWQPQDFTYTDIDIGTSNIYNVYPMGSSANRLSGTKRFITGLSESGLEKLELSKDLVIPATDTDGNTVNGIDSDATNGGSFPIHINDDRDKSIC